MDQFLTSLLTRFAINLVALVLLIRSMQVRSVNSRDFRFSYLALGMTVYFICFFLESVKLELGFALGLFAIFAILRYRTFQIPIKEMTYLFVVIGISVINALTDGKISFVVLVIVNVLFVVGLILLERIFIHEPTYCMTMKCHNLQNLMAGREDELKSELETITKLTIDRFEVSSINDKSSSATVIIYFKKPNGNSGLGEEIKN